MTLAIQVVAHDPALVSRQTIPDESGFLAAQFPAQIVEEADQAVGIVAAWPSLKEHAATAPIAAIANRGANR